MEHVGPLGAGDLISSTAALERFLFPLLRGEILPQPLLKEEMFTVPDVEGAVKSAGLQPLDAGGGRILWLMTGARPGYSTLIGATADLSRTLVHSVNATDVKAESMNPVGERIVRAAFTVTAQHRGRSVVSPGSSDR